VSRRVLLAALLAVSAAAPVVAYLKLGAEVGSRVVTLRWGAFPVRYLVTNRDAPRVGAPDLQAAVARAFATWHEVPTAQTSSQFVGFTGAEPFVDDGVSVIGFQARPDLDRTLGAATFELDATTGAIRACDIFFNTAFDWSVAAGGEAGRFDVESIAVHEIGHLYGLGHSALGETEPRAGGGRSVLGKRAVMFPIAYPRGTIEDRTLEADDVSGLSDLYSTSAATRALGAIAGRVTLNGAGVLGAHVMAVDPATGAAIGGFALNQQGEFVIAGLRPGLYVVRAEPLDDADFDSFFSDDVAVNINFRVTYFATLVAVPAGGAGRSIEIRVAPK
jgi:hypothetical protein